MTRSILMSSTDRSSARSQPTGLSVARRALHRSWILLQTLMDRSRRRVALGELDDRMLRDVGLTRALDEREHARVRERTKLFCLWHM